MGEADYGDGVTPHCEAGRAGLVRQKVNCLPTVLLPQRGSARSLSPLLVEVGRGTEKGARSCADVLVQVLRATPGTSPNFTVSAVLLPLAPYPAAVARGGKSCTARR